MRHPSTEAPVCIGKQIHQEVRLTPRIPPKAGEVRNYGGTNSRYDAFVTLAPISPPDVAQGRFVWGRQTGLAECKPPFLFMRGASSCTVTRATPRGNMRCVSTTECTYLPIYLCCASLRPYSLDRI